MKEGNFIISLDFELFWGVSQSKSKDNYGENILKSHLVVEKLLSLFKENKIEATWAIVGFLFFENFTEITNFIKKNSVIKPKYNNQTLNNYIVLENNIGNDKKLFFAKDLIQKIKKTNGQEIACHTFSHLYAMEDGISLNDFKDDLRYMKIIFDKLGLEIKSIVFPRNQYSESLINECKKTTISSYRGMPEKYMYKTSLNQNIFKRTLRLVDCYLNLSGDNSFIVKKSRRFIDIPASRFLRSYSKKLFLFERLRLRRIKNEMTNAAKNNRNYHLWWHPHNFGKNTKENFIFLEEILNHFNFLHLKYGFKSTNMNNI